jgi:hypothetical protein
VTSDALTDGIKDHLPCVHGFLYRLCVQIFSDLPCSGGFLFSKGVVFSDDGIVRVIQIGRAGSRHVIRLEIGLQQISRETYWVTFGRSPSSLTSRHRIDDCAVIKMDHSQICAYDLTLVLSAYCSGVWHDVDLALAEFRRGARASSLQKVC